MDRISNSDKKKQSPQLESRALSAALPENIHHLRTHSPDDPLESLTQVPVCSPWEKK